MTALVSGKCEKPIERGEGERNGLLAFARRGGKKKA